MANNQEFISTFGLIPRDSGDLLDLPIEFRWEFTRRHPYYLLLWRRASSFRVGAIAASSDETADGYVAVQLLGMIGVSGEPEQPATDFEGLSDCDPAFLSGSVQPMTLRHMASTLIAVLPAADLKVLSGILTLAADPEYAVEDDDDSQSLQRRKANGHLIQLPSPVLDSYLDHPMVYIHMVASQRRIIEDLKSLIRKWKKRLDIRERRTPINEFPKYLKVWDLREGWNTGVYELNAELSFGQISKQLGIPKSTVVNCYRAAFQKIVGQEFTPELWIRVMGLVKVPRLGTEPSAELTSRYRRLISFNARKPAPETRVERHPPDRGQVGVVERESAIEDDHKSVDLVLDMSHLIERGLTDSEIAQELEIEEIGIIAYYRERLEELGESH